jgi:uncharacterized protein (TIGR02300 family)
MLEPQDTSKYRIPVRFLDLTCAMAVRGDTGARIESPAPMPAAGITWAALRHAGTDLPQSAIDSSVATSQVKHRFSEIPRIPHVAKSDLGTKRICPTTGKKFYDLNKNPVISPYTGEVVPIAPIPPPRTRADAAARASAAAAASAAEVTPEPVEAEELVPLEEADAEENTGKVKAVVPESEDDIEIDETIEDDDDDDSTFIADEEEGDEDVTDIIGDVGGDEET